MSRTYVDNAKNRQMGRVGMALGSMPEQNRNRGGTSARQTSSRAYVDNQMNRSLNRVGLPLGAAVVSRNSGHEINGANSSGNRYDSGGDRKQHAQYGTYVDNPPNRRLNRVGLPLGTAVVSRNSGHEINIANRSLNRYDSGTDRKQRSQNGAYVDNPTNRRHNRVGLPLGTAVVSRNSGQVNNGANSSGNRYDSGGDRKQHAQYDTYVDNPTNRRLNRVGLPLGTAVVSRNSGQINNGAYGSGYRYDSGGERKQHAQYDTYVDNPTNRRLNRVGLPKGTMVFPKSKNNKNVANSSESDISVRPKVYVDNPQNRRLGRVGMAHGEAVVWKNTDTSFVPATKTKVYVDNPTNRRLGRVGLPLGTAVFSAKNKCLMQKNYDDTRINRKLDRVGKPCGSLPLKKSKTTAKIPEMLEMIENGDDFSDYIFEDRGSLSRDLGFALIDSQGDRIVAFDQAMYRHNRIQEELSWERSTPTKGPPKTKFEILADYKGKKIPYNELKLRKVIGCGGFGQVHFAKWQETVVAVKKLHSEKISDSRIRDFADEVMKFCTLNHPNIVKFLGACVEKPDLCIVMEYMQMTLFDALYTIEDIDFSEDEKIDIIYQITTGMEYLHDNRIAHCDLKPSNILMDYEEDEICDVKITDFGLSMIIHDTSTSSEELVRYIGTPQYSPPEMLRGDILSAKDMMKADVYSLAILFLEVIFEAEPFPNYTLYQLKTEVGEQGKVPEIPMDPDIDESIEEIMEKAWSYEPMERPSMSEIYAVVRDCQIIYN